MMMLVSEAGEHAHQHLDAEMQGSMRLFRAQRNFYISGFALFLSLVSYIACQSLKQIIQQLFENDSKCHNNFLYRLYHSYSFK